jgi:hypothetical protein
MKPIYKIITSLLCIFASINTNAQPMDIPENLSGEIWKTPNEDFIVQFFENGIYEITEKYRYYSEKSRKGSVGYEIRTAVISGTYKIADSAIFLNDEKHVIPVVEIKMGSTERVEINDVHPITSIKINKKTSENGYDVTFFGGYKTSSGSAPTHSQPAAKRAKKTLIRTKPIQQQKIDELLDKLNSWVLDKSGAFEADAYERPYAHPDHTSDGEIGGLVSACKSALYQLGATVVWNEKKKMYEFETNQHLIARRSFVEVYVDKMLYQSENAPNDYFLKFTIKNTGKQSLGFHLSHPNNIFYANQWGEYSQPYRGVVDESRMVFKQEDLSPLIRLYNEAALKMIKPDELMDYYINLKSSDDKLVDHKTGFFIVTIDGQMKFTNGKDVELVSLESEVDEVRAIVFPLPAPIKSIPERQWISIDKKIKENRY